MRDLFPGMTGEEREERRDARCGTPGAGPVSGTTDYLTVAATREGPGGRPDGALAGRRTGGWAPMSLEEYLVPCRPPAVKKPRKNNPKGINSGHKTNPCAVCRRHIGQCSWLHMGRPVPGWTAEPVRLVIASTRSRRYVTDTWHILRCPLYVPPSREF